jgi:LPXTG-motif cell wall-anchored protein
VIVVVTNSGGVPVRSVSVTDALVRRLGSSVVCASRVLAPRSSTTCRSGPVRVTRAQAKARVFSNKVRATARTASGQLVRSVATTARLRVQASPARSGKNKHKKSKHSKQNKQNKQSKQARNKPVRPITRLRMVQYVLAVSDVNKNGRLEGGDGVRFAFRAVNAGTVQLEGLAIVDRRLKRFKVPVTCPSTSLAPGATTTCTSGRLRITPFQAKKGRLGRNFAFATAVSTSGEAVRSNATVITLGRSTAKLTMLPNTGARVGAAELGGLGLLLLAGAALITVGRRRRPQRASVGS